MERICISGSSGFLGSVILNSLKNQSFHVETIGRSITNSVYCDLSQNVPSLINEFDTFIHVAGKAHVLPKNIEDENDFFRVNLMGTKNLIKGIELSGFFPKSFVFISTVAVYGLDKGEMLNENTPRLAKSAYGLSKILAEDFIVDWGKNNDIKITIIRLPLVVGLTPPGNLGSMINGIKSGLYFNIAGGTAKKSMVLATDIADFILVLASHGGIYHLTDGYNPSFFELSKIIASHYKKNNVLNFPLYIMKLFAKGFDYLQNILKIDLPFNSEKLLKMTQSLTFCDNMARNLGWRPKQVLEHPSFWLR
jgi:nucleoside-diphosphate-sugar epimerase